ncbi:hypothetical protein MN116_008875 [Schistosoma mekongi]|uniref:Toll-interacting protein n=1 Tax=Schistosoma mekongi TaxID=38744 RepID=A0AAE1Z4T0_SCHME|nr:hypothetical protein MN116_008875 [Schistosoma mekongi]
MSNDDHEVDLLDLSNPEVKPSNSSNNIVQKPTIVTENGLKYNHDSNLTHSVSPLREQLLLQLDVTQARLVKNYGFLPMNLYCIIRIGDARFETQTSSRSGKHPIWNETFRCWLHDGVDKLSLEVVSESIFSSSQVAHAVISFPRSLYDGIALNQWFELSGQQGENLEGSINLVFQCRKVPVNLPLQSTPLYCQPRLGVIGDMRVLPKPISTEEVQSIHEIFPSVEEDTIRSLLATHHGNREVVISELLRMTSET